MFSSAWCPYCTRAKQLLDSKGLSYQEIIVDGKPELRASMMQESGRYTVPQIWINEQHVGGFMELYSLERSSQLNDLIAKEP